MSSNFEKRGYVNHRNDILFYDENPGFRHKAQRILGATGSRIIIPESLEELKQVVLTHDPAVRILGLEGHQYLTKEVKHSIKKPSILISEEPFGKIYPFLTSVETMTNFVAKNKNDRARGKDLLTTVAKILYNDIFGIDKYIGWGASSLVLHVRNSKTRGEYIETILHYCRNLGLRQKHIDSIEIFCEELIMNALFNAPRDQDNNPRFEDTIRTEEITLSPIEAARIEIGSDGERLAISVSDPFGAIDRDTILEYLSKCFDGDHSASKSEKKKGAGLGLFMCFNAVSHFVVNVCPGLRTEIIGLFDIDLSVKESRQNHPSFHYFATSNTATQFRLNGKAKAG